uniref:G_PROTEIN_RECEP_F1_2 domain-containing protein n=1 Tax=Heterorhabditis bacteriophora TaxID=37862 RepID=A0A1I7X274_HETBA
MTDPLKCLQRSSIAIAIWNISNVMHMLSRRPMVFWESSYGTHFPSLRIFPISCNRLETVALSTPSYSAIYSWACHGFASNNDFKASVFAIRGVPERYRSLTSNSPSLKHRNQYLEVLWERTSSVSTGHIDFSILPLIDGFQARFPGLYAIYTETPERRRINAMYAIVLIDVFLAFVHFFMSTMLLYGSIKYNKNCVWPWFFSAGPIIIMSTVYAVMWWSGDVFNEQLTMSVAEFVMSLAVNGICLVIVMFFYWRLKGKLTSNKPARRHSHRRREILHRI